MQNARLAEAQAGIKTAERNMNNLRYADDTTLMAESEEELDSLDKSKRGEWNSWLKTQHLKNFKIMASRPITSWQIDGETIETVTDFIFLDSKITADGDCSHEIKRCLLLGRKAMTNPDSILKSRDIALPTKVCVVKAIVFPVVLHGCVSWTIKKAEHWRMMLLNCGVGEDSPESPLDCKEIQLVNPKGNQSWIFIGRTNAEAETPILWPPDAKNWLIGKDPDAGKDWRREEKGRQRMIWLDGITDVMDMSRTLFRTLLLKRLLLDTWLHSGINFGKTFKDFIFSYFRYNC